VAGAGLVLSALVVGVQPATAGEKGLEAFDFGRTTEETLITLRYFGGMTWGSPEIALYGDGRIHVDVYVSGTRDASAEATLEGASQAASSRRVLRSYDAQVEREEREALLTDVVLGRLLEYDEADITARREALGRVLPIVSDAPSIEVELDLRSLVSGVSGIRAENRFVVCAPRQLSRAFPEIREYAAIWRLIEKIQDINRRARAERGIS